MKPPRVRGVKRPPLKRVFIGNFLDKGKKPRNKLRNNGEVSKYLVQQALIDLEGKPIKESNPETDEMLSRMMASEVVSAISRKGSKSAISWYTDAIRKAVDVLGLLQPEIVDDNKAIATMPEFFRTASDARTILFAAMAITSQSVTVNENIGYALEQYRYFIKNNKFLPKAYGSKGKSIKLNLERFNFILEAFENDIGKLRAFLNAEFSMRDLKEAGRENGININAAEMMDELVNGSIMFGPKIGAFYQNLRGNFTPLTIDLWFCRTWGRYTGTLTRPDVTSEQMERLISSLKRDRSDSRFKPNIDSEEIRGLESTELLKTVADIKRIWERYRISLKDDGFDNQQIAAFKQMIEWPNAAEAILQSLIGTVDSPTSASQRKWMRNVTKRAVEILNKNGYDLTVADTQAILWFPEKDLYDHLANRKPGGLTVSYDEAAIIHAKKEGIEDDTIFITLQPYESRRLRERDVPEAARESDKETDNRCNSFTSEENRQTEKMTA